MPAGISYMIASVNDVALKAPCDAESVKSQAKEKLTRSGLTLADEEIIRALDKLFSWHYVPAIKNRSGKVIVDKTFATLEQMGALFDEMQVAVSEIGKSMRRGKASADPIPEKMGMSTVCEKCAYKPVCRYY